MTTWCHTVLLCLYVADPATSLASNSVLMTLSSSEDSLFLSLYYYLINIVHVKMLSLNFPLQNNVVPL